MPTLAACYSSFADTLTLEASRSTVDRSAASTPLHARRKACSGRTTTYSAESYHTATSDASSSEANSSGTSIYELHESTNDPERNPWSTFPATPSISFVPFFTLAAYTSASTTNDISPSPPTDVTKRKNSKQNIVGRAVGGAVGGGMFVIILALLIFLSLRRYRQRRRPPSQQYLRSVPIIPPAVSQDRDIKDANSRAASPSTYTSTRTTSNYKAFMRPWTAALESGSTFRDDSSVTIQSISAPFVPPPPRTNIPEAQPPSERLPSDSRNRPSKFVEQLMVNSTNLGVLVAIARAEAGQRQEQANFMPSSSSLNPPSGKNVFFLLVTIAQP
ncbi:hypothetical protein J3R30DRAFT_3855555 [Lentinula aciculospora]|uniref:Uncharacterized protein n=1 Tax=Lentinula aciculospora TaxID=153920 RepID=A0A9W9AIF1_9AGAR|nr:hypothetical protein J3R30DRAFT_3855555 [Lentinula aciculospora]